LFRELQHTFTNTFRWKSVLGSIEISVKESKIRGQIDGKPGEESVRRIKGITENEKKVMFALVEDADRTDAEIAEHMDMNESTVSQNRRSLIRKEYIEFLNVPSFHRLGFELIGLVTNYVIPAMHPEISKETYRRFFQDHPEIVDAVCLEFGLFCNGFFLDVTDFLRFIQEFESFFENQGWSRTKPSHIIFPFDISRCDYAYHYAPSLNRIFDLGIPDQTISPPKPLKRSNVNLSKMERRVFSQLIASPNLPDAEIARGVNRSRQSVSDMKRKFLKLGLFKKVVFPTFRSGAYEIVAYVHLDFDSKMTFQKKISVAGNDWWLQSFNTVERNSTLMAAYCFADAEECTNSLREYIKPFQESGLLMAEPEIVTFPVAASEDLLAYYAAPLIRRTLL